MDFSSDDRFAIEQKMYQYSYSFDSHDADGWVNVFTEDGVFEAIMVNESKPIGAWRGAAELRAFAERGATVLHHQSGLVFDDVTGTSARTRAMVIVTKQEGPQPVIRTHGVYHDRWRKTPDGWRIEHRLYVSHGYGPQSGQTAETGAVPGATAACG